MSQQVSPSHDLLSFQRLLAAAWVLQSQQDEAQSKLRQEITGGLPDSVDEDTSEAQITVAPDNPQDSGAELERIDEPIPHSALEPSEPIAPVQNEEHPVLRSLAAVRSHMQSLRGVLTVVEPLLVLLIMFMFLLAEAWPREDRASAHVLETSPPRVAPPLVDEGSKTSVQTLTAASAVTLRTPSQRPLRSTPSLQSSHMRVTDAATSSALRDMSRYEVRTLRRQAKGGDAAAAFTLAMAYEAGRLVPQNCKQAAAWVETSAKAGNLAAAYNLGLRYRYGDGILPNATKAAKWLRVAEARGYPKPAIVVSAD